MDGFTDQIRHSETIRHENHSSEQTFSLIESYERNNHLEFKRNSVDSIFMNEREEEKKG